MLEYHLQRLYIWIAFSIMLLLFVLFRWFYYSKFRKDRIKWRGIAKNLKTSDLDMMSKNVVNLPSKYSSKQMAFIENWYMEEGIKQLKSAGGRECYVLSTKPPVPGCKYADVGNIPVNVKVRSNTTLELEEKQVSRTVKLLLLNEWIK